ncbi:putative ubiquitin-RnfH superfamily antitoxin RatB of RatAB toxin-antitoxin module [Vogesella perlucida]|nr:putative ubiquitin-RnfH superfamily antitoxin RatB of RatAB toxin-antitoxin module [Vogesella perlucida]
MAMTERISVEVAYALPARQKIVRLALPAGSTALQAVAASGLAAEFADIDMANLKLGIFSKAVKPETPLREGDRVEIYRPLLADPKAVRRQRAEAGKAMKKGG